MSRLDKRNKIKRKLAVKLYLCSCIHVENYCLWQESFSFICIYLLWLLRVIISSQVKDNSVCFVYVVVWEYTLFSTFWIIQTRQNIFYILKYEWQNVLHLLARSCSMCTLYVRQVLAVLHTITNWDKFGQKKRYSPFKANFPDIGKIHVLSDGSEFAQCTPHTHTHYTGAPIAVILPWYHRWVKMYTLWMTK